MASNNDRYVVTLGMNSDEAVQKLAELRNQATALNQQLTQAMASGSKAQAGRIRQQLRQTNNDIRRFEDELKSVDRVMGRLSKASIKEMEGALRTLQRRIKNFDQGSEQFNRMSTQIRQLRTQLSHVNAELRTQETLWTRMNTWLNNAQTFMIGAAVFLSGLGQAARSAVSSFAQMDEQMADTKKYTGMTEEQVKDLNEAFKQMDTRTGREQLNELAQEAGRLGKSTQEDVMGYVKAADVINVALSELGEGATQSIAKLSNIFKIEAQYGTYDSMLKIGSVINDLAQNCTASTPYLVEFANRLAGVGVQANLSIQQIIGIGAVLDSNAQQLEASATAVGQVLTRMYQEPAKYAKVAGLDVKKFTKLLKEDANEAFLTFLETLSKKGDLSVLSPMFADMEEKGARVITALSTLSAHIDEVRAQQQNANKAFEEGSSVLNEYEIFNNTTQAGIDKAKKSFQELAISLGEQLAPMMKHIYTSGSLFLTVLSKLVGFIISNRKAIVALAVAVASYYATLGALYLLKQKDAIMTGAQTAATKAHTFAVEVLQGVIGSLRIAYIALTQGIEAAKTAYAALTASMSVNPFGALVAAVGLAVTAIHSVISAQNEFKDKTDEIIDNMDVFDSKAQEEQAELDKLFGCLRDCTKGTEEYEAIRKQIISRWGVYLKGLYNERTGVVNLGDAYNFLADAIKKAAEARAIAEAKKQITQQYYQDLSKKMGELREELKASGVEGVVAERIVHGVATAIKNGDTTSLKNLEKDATSLGLSSFKGFWNYATGGNPGKTIRELAETQATYKTQMSALDALSASQRGEYGRATNRQIFGWNANGTHYPGWLETAGEAISQGKGIKITISDQDAVKLRLISQAEADKRFDNGFRGPIDPENQTGAVFSPFVAKKDLGGRINNGYVFSYGNNYGPWKGNGYAPLATQVSMHTYHLSLEKTEEFYKKVAQEAYTRTENGEYTPPSTYVPEKPENSPYTRQKKEKKKKEKKESEAAKNKRLRKALEDDFAKLKAEWEAAYQENLKLYAQGVIDYRTLLNKNREADIKYLDGRQKLLEDANLKETSEYKQLIKEKESEEKKFTKNLAKYDKRQLEREKQRRLEDLNLRGDEVNSPIYNDEYRRLQTQYAIQKEFLEKELKIYKVGSEEFEKVREEIEDTDRQLNSKVKELLNMKHADWAQKYAYERAATEMGIELDLLSRAKEKGLLKGDEFDKYKTDIVRKHTEQNLPDYLREADPTSDKWNEQQDRQKQEDLARIESLHNQKNADGTPFMSEEEYQKQKSRVIKHYRDLALEASKQFGSTHANMLIDLMQSWDDFFSATEESGGNWATRLADLASAAFAVIGTYAQQTSELVQACDEAELAKTEAKYDKYLEYAQGNAFMTKRIEKQKERELSKMKADAAKKQFAFQVAMATAQTAQNAIAAYGAALAIPGVGLTLAPIAAAMATAAGLLQIATIIKQQETAKAQGYSEGGFTEPGPKLKEVGVVHAGEWVASQKLVNNPTTRPIINALEYAQRNNRFPVVGAPTRVKALIPEPQGPSASPAVMAYASTTGMLAEKLASQDAAINRMCETLDRLSATLDAPMAAVVTVSGDAGINRKQEEYSQYIKNKSPRYKRIYRYANSDSK